MANSIEDVEQAILAWLNSLDLQEENLTDIAGLKDGVFLITLLNKM